MTRSHLVVFALTCALGTASVQTARAQAGDANDTLLTTGEGLLRDGEAVAARAVLRRAHESSPSARSAGTLGLAELAAGDPIAADVLLRSLPSDDAWVRREQARITEALAQIDRQVGVVVLLGAAAGREVVVEENGVSRRIGATPLLPFRVRPGRVVVRVDTASRDLVVTAGGRVEVDFTTDVATTPFPEGPPGDFAEPFPTGPDTNAPNEPTPRSDGPIAFGAPGEVPTIPPAVRERFARGEVVDAPEGRSEWQPSTRRRQLALGIMGRALLSFDQVGDSFDTYQYEDSPRAVLVSHVTGRFALLPWLAVVGRLGVAVVLNGEGEGSTQSRNVPAGWYEVSYRDEWDGTVGLELDALAELSFGIFFVDVGARLRLWFGSSEQRVTYQDGRGGTSSERGDVLQVGTVGGAVIRPGLWLDRQQRIRFSVEFAGGKNMLEVGGGLEVFLF